MIKIDTFRENEENPRQITEEHLKKLMKSIKQFEKMMTYRPIVIDENNIILGGNQRFKALVELGYKEIPNDWVVKKTDFTDKEKQEFIVKDNLNYGYWDWSKIEVDFESTDLVDWGLDLPFVFEKKVEFDEPTSQNTFEFIIDENNDEPEIIHTEEEVDGIDEDYEGIDEEAEYFLDLENNEALQTESALISGQSFTNKFVTITIPIADKERMAQTLGLMQMKRILTLNEIKNIVIDENK